MLGLISSRLDLISSMLDLISSRLDLISNMLDLISSRLDLISNMLDLISGMLHRQLGRLLTLCDSPAGCMYTQQTTKHMM